MLFKKNGIENMISVLQETKAYFRCFREPDKERLELSRKLQSIFREYKVIFDHASNVREHLEKEDSHFNQFVNSIYSININAGMNNFGEVASLLTKIKENHQQIKNQSIEFYKRIRLIYQHLQNIEKYLNEYFRYIPIPNPRGGVDQGATTILQNLNQTLDTVEPNIGKCIEILRDIEKCSLEMGKKIISLQTHIDDLSHKINQIKQKAKEEHWIFENMNSWFAE